jgi:chromosome segregation ATPase
LALVGVLGGSFVHIGGYWLFLLLRVALFLFVCLHPIHHADLDQNQANPGDDSLVKSFQAAKADITSHSDAITSIDAQLNAKMADVLALDSQITNAQNEEAAARMWWSTKESVVGLIKGLLPHVDSIEATLKNLNNNVQQLKSEISRAKAGQKAAAASVKALAAQILSNQPIDQGT